MSEWKPNGVDYMRATKVARIRLGWPRGMILSRVLHEIHVYLLSSFGFESMPRWYCRIALKYSKAIVDEIGYIAKNWEMFALPPTPETPPSES